MAIPSKKLKPKHRNVEKIAVNEGTSESNMTNVATSKVEDDCEVRENKDAVTTIEGDTKQTELKAAEKVLSSQKTDRDSSSKGKKHKSQVTSRGSEDAQIDSEGKARKKAIAERRDGPHKHGKSARKKHQALLKLKLKRRKAVSKARLKSYGLSL